MAPKADELADEILKSRDAYLAGLSERTRTLCLGALALIWGLFSQKPTDHAFDITLIWKRILLAIGLSAIAVLVLDFGEFACGYQFRRRIIGESVWGKISYETWEVRMRLGKIVLGSISLLALCISLTIILATPLLAHETTEYPYFGMWCGGSKIVGTFTCIETTNDLGVARVSLSYKDKAWIKCRAVKRAEQTFTTSCGKADITIARGKDSPLSMVMTVAPSYEVTLKLYKWPPG